MKTNIDFTIDIKRSFELKDEVLNYISSSFNVAQFLSFSPNLEQRFSRIYGREPNFKFGSLTESLEVLLDSSLEKSINIRTYKPVYLKGNPFYYGIKDVLEAEMIVSKSASEGFYTIVNETIDINDSGVSGVVMNDIIEFSPLDTPKCVEKPGICSLPRKEGINILNKVYGFTPNLDFDSSLRVEFSIHPKRRGFKKEHTIIWEVEDGGAYSADFDIVWPNNFSRFLGDKVFGLLIADEFGAKVPRSNVFTRNVAPFVFGQDTNCSEIWFRTCPAEKTPGKYPTYYGWKDPFTVLNYEEILNNVPSILSQNSVDAIFSGAAVPSKSQLLIEGVNGFGDEFMIGEQAPTKIPSSLKDLIKKQYDDLKSKIGEINIEWVYDGSDIWLVQLSKSTILSNSKVIYPGKVEKYIKFPIEEGLEKLRELIKTLKENEGIELVGKIGITSHFGDILRNGRIPSRLRQN